ncbi:hypothetical protein FDUTEX481_03941 [Tolypothrix sp. PCC 7601]|nr:hypothetical protein FDUTEX481_03941 [Tolypothrix sp. PCC 7601]
MIHSNLTIKYVGEIKDNWLRLSFLQSSDRRKPPLRLCALSLVICHW